MKGSLKACVSDSQLNELNLNRSHGSGNAIYRTCQDLYQRFYQAGQEMHKTRQERLLASLGIHALDFFC
ncbi:hypothetical protein RRG08_001524 [Elysia crispata]|uniref:Uncharacterized protein n=1 Tax=Elysia crispata TaxID=231223 RepID=A0AAE1AFK9_9GAST|nr:hypothetical protein RRG08_001524 [Elysia crispata]